MIALFTELPQVGIEPTTSRLEGERSNPLSYKGGDIFNISALVKQRRSYQMYDRFFSKTIPAVGVEPTTLWLKATRSTN